MIHTLHVETKLVSEELCALLRQVDPAVFVFRDEPEVRARIERVASRLRELVVAAERDEAGGRIERLRERLRALLAAVERATPTRTPSPKAAWIAFQREVQPAYESLLVTLRGVVAAPPSIRPTNHARSLWHVGSGLAVLGLIQLLPERGWLVAVSGAIAVSAWSMELARRLSERVNERLLWVFKHVAHPHERYRVNSSTWYVTALLLLALFGTRLSQSLAVVVLAVADPAAALIGRRFGRTRLLDNRSLEGTLAFFVAGALSSLVVMWAFGPPASLSSRLFLAAVAGLAGAVTELFSSRLDDNFTIPVAVAAAVTIAGAG
ncbi:diacylglycerol/polyprenol kinase family protein [Sorangium sp. So ce1389]|uniref:diacylglycerol/polyprenol kinase family protein n=1 Tax=Sorangium sp. So ce1389 TaxID=3133336 RepID=UPI003F641A8B